MAQPPLVISQAAESHKMGQRGRLSRPLTGTVQYRRSSVAADSEPSRHSPAPAPHPLGRRTSAASPQSAAYISSGQLVPRVLSEGQQCLVPSRRTLRRGRGRGLEREGRSVCGGGGRADPAGGGACIRDLALCQMVTAVAAARHWAPGGGGTGCSPLKAFACRRGQLASLVTFSAVANCGMIP